MKITLRINIRPISSLPQDVPPDGKRTDDLVDGSGKGSIRELWRRSPRCVCLPSNLALRQLTPIILAEFLPESIVNNTEASESGL